MSDLNMMIGKRIKIFRKKIGLSQEQLSAQAGLSRAYIGKVEIGKERMSFESLNKVINALDITIEEFFAFSDKRLELSEDSSLLKIIDILNSRNKKEQKYVLELIKSLFEFKDNL